jgi:hypothetical protein
MLRENLNSIISLAARQLDKHDTNFELVIAQTTPSLLLLELATKHATATFSLCWNFETTT